MAILRKVVPAHLWICASICAASRRIAGGGDRLRRQALPQAGAHAGEKRSITRRGMSVGTCVCCGVQECHRHMHAVAQLKLSGHLRPLRPLPAYRAARLCRRYEGCAAVRYLVSAALRLKRSPPFPHPETTCDWPIYHLAAAVVWRLPACQPPRDPLLSIRVHWCSRADTTYIHRSVDARLPPTSTIATLLLNHVLVLDLSTCVVCHDTRQC